MSRVIVLSAGTHPEPAFLAAGASRAGVSTMFMSAALWPSDHPLMSFVRSSPVVPDRMRHEILRRELPEGLNMSNTRRRAAVGEFLLQSGMRLSPRRTREMVRARTLIFRRAAGRVVAKDRGKLEFVIAQYTSALDAFRSAEAAKRILLYPIAHHRWMREFLGREAERNPEWAPFLQGHDIVGEDEADLDAEIELADLIVVPSSFARDSFVEVGVDPSRLKVVPLGSDLSVVPRSPRTGSFTVMFAGQLNQRKGISYLLDAFSSAEIPGARLVLIGGGGEDIRARIGRDYPYVEIHGTRPRWKLKLAMAEADVLVMPSLAEGFGLVALEAMSVGTPAIVTPHTFGRDVITDGVDGWITPVGQSGDLARLLASVASDSDQLARVSHAAAVTSRRFSWDEYGSRVLSAVGVVP